MRHQPNGHHVLWLQVIIACCDFLAALRNLLDSSYSESFCLCRLVNELFEVAGFLVGRAQDNKGTPEQQLQDHLQKVMSKAEFSQFIGNSFEAEEISDKWCETTVATAGRRFVVSCTSSAVITHLFTVATAGRHFAVSFTSAVITHLFTIATAGCHASLSLSHLVLCCFHYPFVHVSAILSSLWLMQMFR